MSVPVLRHKVAKKKIARRGLRKPRYGDLTPQQIDEQAVALADQVSAQMKAIAEAMRSLKIDAIPIDGLQKFPEAVAKLSDYIKSLNIGLTAAKHDRGQ